MNFNSNSVPSLPVVQYNQEAWQLVAFWQRQIHNIETAEAFKSQLRLPLSRVKRIMKSDGVTEMVSAEAPIVLSKACEFFIQKLAICCWHSAQLAYKNNIERIDIAKAIVRNDDLDFLADALPPALIQPQLQAAQQAANAVQGGNQAGTLSLGTNLMGNAMLNTGGNQRTVMDIAAENQVAMPFGPGFMGYPMMNRPTQGANGAQGGSFTSMLYGANLMGNPMLNMGNEFGNAVNAFPGSQAPPIPYGAGFRGNLTIMTGNEGNSVNMAAGTYPTLPHNGADFMGNPMMNMGNNQGTGNDLNIMGGNQVAAVPNNAGFMGNPMMNMGNDNVGSTQQLPQSSNMVVPSFMPSHNLPHNYLPK